MFVLICMNEQVCIYVYVYMGMCLCIYMYICMCICMYIYIHYCLTFNYFCVTPSQRVFEYISL